MSEPKHPRHETEEERVEAHKELRKNIARQIRSHGVPLLLIPLGEQSVTGTGRSFFNARRNQEFTLNRTLTRFEEPQITLSIHKIDETDTMEELQYICNGRGLFRRNDFSVPFTDHSTPEASVESSTRMVEHLEANMDALSSGITGQPITAEEARSLIDLVSDAEPQPDPMGRIPVAW